MYFINNSCMKIRNFSQYNYFIATDLITSWAGNAYKTLTKTAFHFSSLINFFMCILLSLDQT
jgi:hypothetical protein